METFAEIGFAIAAAWLVAIGILAWIVGRERQEMDELLDDEMIDYGSLPADDDGTTITSPTAIKENTEAECQ